MPLYYGGTLIGGVTATLNDGGSEDLTAVLDAQEELISELEAELEGKAAGSGGASVETCTVNFKDTSGGYVFLYCFFYTDASEGCKSGGRLGSSGSTESSFDYTINNVVCGTKFYIFVDSNTITPELTYSNNVTVISNVYGDSIYADYNATIFQINASNGETVTIEFGGDD